MGSSDYWCGQRWAETSHGRVDCRKVSACAEQGDPVKVVSHHDDAGRNRRFAKTRIAGFAGVCGPAAGGDFAFGLRAVGTMRSMLTPLEL